MAWTARSGPARLAGAAPRRYRLVVLDHGQSQAPCSLNGVRRWVIGAELMQEHVQTVDASVEGWGAQTRSRVTSRPGMRLKLAARANEGLTRAQQTPVPGKAAEEPVVVLGSGNLGLVEGRGGPGWTSGRWKGVVGPVPGLAAIPALFTVHRRRGPGSDQRQRSPRSRRRGGGGRRPVGRLGSDAARVLRRALMDPEAPDLYVNSMVDPVTNDVAAFEGLVDPTGAWRLQDPLGRPVLPT